MITTVELIERLQKINKDVIVLETAYEYGGNCCTCPSNELSKLIRELEAKGYYDQSVMEHRNAASSRESYKSYKLYARRVIAKIRKLHIPHDIIMRVKSILDERNSKVGNPERFWEIQNEIKDILAPYTKEVDPQILLKYIEDYEDYEVDPQQIYSKYIEKLED